MANELSISEFVYELMQIIGVRLPMCDTIFPLSVYSISGCYTFVV